MRRVFHVLGIAFVIVIASVGGLVAFAAWKGSGLDSECKAYVDQAIVDVGENWDKTQLIRRASPRLLRVVSPDQITTLFQQLTKFGPLVHYDGARGQATMKLAIVGDSGVTAHYEASATFANGHARFRIDLSKDNQHWVIDGFYVDLTPPVTAPPTKTL
jgi:hypothetical protein